MAALTGLSSGGVAIANAHHAPLDRQASWLPVIWGSDQSRDLRQHDGQIGRDREVRVN
jgi:hypothetical protein